MSDTFAPRDLSRADKPFCHHRGEMADRIRANDWATTPLGPIEHWPQSLRTAVEIMLASPAAVSVMWGPEHIQLYNDAYIPIADGRHPAALGRSAAINWAEAYADFLGPVLDRAFSGEAVVVHKQKVPLNRPHGRTEDRVFTATFSPIRDETGAVGGVFHPLIEVTEQVRAEAAMRELHETLEQRVEQALARQRESDALYRAYFENTPEALFVIAVEQDGFYVEQINPAHEAGVGFKPEDVRGKRIEEILPVAAAERVLESYRHVVNTGTLYQYREVFDLSGNPQHWDTSLVPVRDADGRIMRLIGSSRNVTRQVVAEEALRQAQKMEAMGSLTGGVAHDFNNLLTPIIGSLDMLQRAGMGGPREQRLIGGALQSAERAKTLVQRLLAFARRQPLQPVPVNVSTLIADMAELVSSTTGPQIKIVVDAPRDLPAAEADPNQLEMALLNLSVNARDAMPAGGTLRISASEESVTEGHSSELKPGRYIRLSVADTGIGMDEATLKRAVEPFFSTKGVGKGTGLGLSMAHGLAAQLGGALTIQSRAGLGTNVELWLPQSSDVPAAAEPLQRVAGQPARGTVLLVEDEELVRASTADMLVELGYAVQEAESAEEALRLIASGLSVDLLVTDHLMPGMTGTELAHELHGRWPDLPVLVVSGYADVDGVAPDLPRLPKPFRQADLAGALSEISSRPARNPQH